ncbi:MAG: hypothetical protein HY513_05890 [Candidatus Aenigmarchaeota archaeon]|nr:hypothetical protein [Candidatus Aenigmarchaeota archaeon]
MAAKDKEIEKWKTSFAEVGIDCLAHVAHHGTNIERLHAIFTTVPQIKKLEVHLDWLYKMQFWEYETGLYKNPEYDWTAIKDEYKDMAQIATQALSLAKVSN